MSAADSILVFDLPTGLDSRGAGWYWRLPDAERSVGPYDSREEALGEAQDCADDRLEELHCQAKRGMRRALHRLLRPI